MRFFYQIEAIEHNMSHNIFFEPIVSRNITETGHGTKLQPSLNGFNGWKTVDSKKKLKPRKNSNNSAGLPTVCNICGATFGSETGLLKSHIKSIHEKVPKFKMKLHNERTKSYFCSNSGCKFSSEKKEKFAERINTVHKGEEATNDTHEKVKRNPSSYRNMLKHNNTMVCNDCHFNTDTVCSYKQHKQICHLNYNKEDGPISNTYKGSSDSDKLEENCSEYLTDEIDCSPSLVKYTSSSITGKTCSGAFKEPGMCSRKTTCDRKHQGTREKQNKPKDNVCNICGRRYTYKSGLRNHINRSHYKQTKCWDGTEFVSAVRISLTSTRKRGERKHKEYKESIQKNQRCAMVFPSHIESKSNGNTRVDREDLIVRDNFTTDDKQSHLGSVTLKNCPKSEHVGPSQEVKVVNRYSRYQIKEKPSHDAGHAKSLHLDSLGRANSIYSAKTLPGIVGRTGVYGNDDIVLHNNTDQGKTLTDIPNLKLCCNDKEANIGKSVQRCEQNQRIGENSIAQNYPNAMYTVRDRDIQSLSLNSCDNKKASSSSTRSVCSSVSPSYENDVRILHDDFVFRTVMKKMLKNEASIIFGRVNIHLTLHF